MAWPFIRLTIVKIPLQTFVALFTSLTMAFYAYPMTYEVKKGDTLSEIIFKYMDGKIYGDDGLVEKVARQNPHLKNADRIFPGDKIELDIRYLKKKYRVNLAELKRRERRLKRANSIRSKSSEAKKNITDPYETTTGSERKISSTPDSESSHFGTSYFTLMPLITYYRLDSSQIGSDTSSSSAVSDLGKGVYLDWGVNWSPSFKTNIFGSYATTQFSANGSRQVSTGDSSEYSFGLGSTYIFSPYFETDFQLGLISRYYLRANDSNDVSIDELAQPFLSLRPRLFILKRNLLSTFVDFQYQVNLGGDGLDYKVNSGNLYGIGVGIIHNRRNWGQIFGRVAYQQGTDEAEIVEVENKKVEASIGVRWQIGDEEE